MKHSGGVAVLGAAVVFVGGVSCQSGQVRNRPVLEHETANIQVDPVFAVRRSLATVMAEVPLCATSCIEEITTGQDCADGTCLCFNNTMGRNLAECVSKACSIAEGILTINKTQSPCNIPPRDRATPFAITSITLCAVTGLFVLARLLFKTTTHYHNTLTASDYFILVSIFVGLPCTILNITGLTHNGLGKDVWTLTPTMVVRFGKVFYVQQILYVFLVTSIKMSLLFFYLSIFPGVKARAVLWATVVFTGLFGAVFVLISVFQCVPIPFYWERYGALEDGGGGVQGRCTRINLLGWIHGGVSVGIDVWMICIPLSQIRKLELHWKKKVGAVIMFMTGMFVTVVSALRLKSLIYFANSLNPTWDEWPVALWSTIEINVGLMCACFPTMRLILVRIWPRVFGSSVPSASDRSAVSQGTNGTSSFSARKAQIRLGSVDTQTTVAGGAGGGGGVGGGVEVSPRLMDTDTTFELDVKYPTWDDGEGEEEEDPFEAGCHAK